MRGMETNMICAKWSDVETYLETIPGDSSIVIEEVSSKDVYSVQWLPDIVLLEHCFSTNTMITIVLLLCLDSVLIFSY